DVDGNPNCWRSWSGVIDDELELNKDIHYIKPLHGRPAWQTFAMYYDGSEHFEGLDERDWAEERAEEVYGHNSKLSSGEDRFGNGLDEDDPTSCYESGLDEDRIDDLDGCANSFIIVCMAFDNLDATS